MDMDVPFLGPTGLDFRIDARGLGGEILLARCLRDQPLQPAEGGEFTARAGHQQDRGQDQPAEDQNGDPAGHLLLSEERGCPEDKTGHSGPDARDKLQLLLPFRSRPEFGRPGIIARTPRPSYV